MTVHCDGTSRRGIVSGVSGLSEEGHHSRRKRLPRRRSETVQVSDSDTRRGIVTARDGRRRL